MQDNSRPQPIPSDEALVARVVQRDAEAFSLLYDRYARTVFALAAHMLGKTEAEDVVQEVFLSLWNKSHQYLPHRGSFSGWFIAIARNQVIDHLNRRSKQSRIAAAEGIDQLLDSLQDADTSVEEQVWLRDSAAAALQAMNSIPEEQRRVLALAYFGGLSQSAIAEHLGIPLGTVKKRVRLGLQKLRASLAPGVSKDDGAPGQTRADGDRANYGL